MRELTLNTTAFNRALSEFMAGSKREAVVVLKEQARGIMRNLFMVTPPGRANLGSGKARKKGRNNVKADVLKVVRPVTRNPQQTNVAALIKAHRRDGRVRHEVNPRITVPLDAFKAYVAKKQAMVGFLASGWNEAAARLGVKPAGWIWQNEGPGDMQIIITDKGIRIVATNKEKYASSISKLRSRLQWAVNQQGRKIERRLKRFQEEQARKAGFKT